MTSVIFSPEANADLEEIADYIAFDNPGRAISFVEELRRKASNIRYSPLAYPRRQDLPGDLRAAIHKSYNILYRVSQGQVEIARVVHGARNIQALFGGD